MRLVRYETWRSLVERATGKPFSEPGNVKRVP